MATRTEEVYNELRRELLDLNGDLEPGQRLKLLGSIRPRDFVPITPAIAEPSTGETMGQSAEKMAKINHIAREDQDQFALRSHRLAAAGTQDGRLTREIMAVYVPPRFETSLAVDNGVRADGSIDRG